MKKKVIAITAVLTFLVLLGISSSSSAVETIYPNVPQYELSKNNATDPRVLEFTPKSAPYMTCIIITTGSGAGLSCFPKKDDNNE